MLSFTRRRRISTAPAPHPSRIAPGGEFGLYFGRPGADTDRMVTMPYHHMFEFGAVAVLALILIARILMR